MESGRIVIAFTTSLSTFLSRMPSTKLARKELFSLSLQIYSSTFEFRPLLPKIPAKWRKEGLVSSKLLFVSKKGSLGFATKSGELINRGRSGRANMAVGYRSRPSLSGNRMIKGGLAWMRLDRARFPTEIRVATLLREDPQSRSF